MEISVADMSDEQLTIMFRNREAFALFVWEPYLHNPKPVIVCTA